MEHYAGIDVSLELSSVCVVDAQGKTLFLAFCLEPCLVGFPRSWRGSWVQTVRKLKVSAGEGGA